MSESRRNVFDGEEPEKKRSQPVWSGVNFNSEVTFGCSLRLVFGPPGGPTNPQAGPATFPRLFLSLTHARDAARYLRVHRRTLAAAAAQVEIPTGTNLPRLQMAPCPRLPKSPCYIIIASWSAG